MTRVGRGRPRARGALGCIGSQRKAPAQSCHSQCIRLIEDGQTTAPRRAVVLHDRRGEIQDARPGEGAGTGVGCVDSHPAGVPDTDVKGAVDSLKPPLQPLGVHHQVDGMGRAGDLGRPPGVEGPLAAGLREEVQAPGGRDQEDCWNRTLWVAQPGQ